MAGKYARQGYRGRAKKVDANQAEIVAALEAIPGVTVVDIGKPLDLLVGYKGITHLFEVKNPDGKNRLEPDQEKFLSDWTGREPVIVRTIDDCLSALGIGSRAGLGIYQAPR